ncbi:PIN domain-containing protein [Infirmifilum lucidum]|uniref:PIN domain-containing protein n=1 Tax=Infirmifilum lucidum TaxID=2776706 RepID=A0A7L9FIY1_9CREN|nr:PIN domain-containing protein [Infirmifilum lucidum]
MDSTYILPILGVGVEGIEDALNTLRELRRGRKATFYYTAFNILEALGKVARLGYNLETVSTGLSLIEEEFEQASPSTPGYLKALELRRRGFRDLIDLLLYATAATQNLLFLTRDRDLISFLEKNGEDTGVILYEEDFLRAFR